MHKILIASLLAATAFGASAAPPLPAGILITATASGATDGLLGLDHGFADEPGSGTTGLAAADLEYLTRDYAAAVDFFTDGSLLVYNNSGDTSLPGSYTLSFSFTGLSQALTGVVISDLSGVSSGTVGAQLLTDHSFSLSFNNVSTSTAFGSFGAQLSFAAPVPEPGSYALFGLGLALLAGLRRAPRSLS